MNATLFDSQKDISQIALGDLPQCLPTDSFFWLDLGGASAEEIRAVASSLGLDDQTSTWLPRFGKRSRFDMENQRIRISAWTVEGSAQLSEVHLLHTPTSWLLTVHSGAEVTMNRARGILSLFVDPKSLDRNAIFVVMNEMLSGFEPLLEHCNEWRERLEMQILQSPKQALLQELAALRQQLLALQRPLVPHRDEMRDFVVSADGAMAQYAQRLQQYSERVAGLVDEVNDQRQRVTEAMQGYSASMSNAQARVINRLTIISAIFLPLSFLTGFFGMNFQWMIGRIASAEAFWLLGIGLFASVLAFMLGLFLRQGWLWEKPASANGATAPTASPPGAAMPADRNQAPGNPPIRNAPNQIYPSNHEE
jgi:magnesium transporter